MDNTRRDCGDPIPETNDNTAIGGISLCLESAGRSIQVACEEDATIYEVAALFGNSLRALGYSPDLVDEIIPEWVHSRGFGLQQQSLTESLDEANEEITRLARENAGYRKILYAPSAVGEQSDKARTQTYGECDSGPSCSGPVKGLGGR